MPKEQAPSTEERCRPRLLIVDFDFFSAVGGGQTFYRRVVERHPSWDVYYPSRGKDVRAAAPGHLPPNAHPFPIDAARPHEVLRMMASMSDYERSVCAQLAGVAAAIQGNVFDCVEVPSFLPVAHLVRPVFAMYGIIARHVTLGLLGWPSVSVGMGFDAAVHADLIRDMVRVEAEAVEAADAVYTISRLHAAENEGHKRESIVIDIHDALEEFPLPAAQPPGEGRPDLWYVGRLDGAKGPDLFVEMAARMPRELYGSCFLTGPNNADWCEGPSWADQLLEQAGQLGLDVQYVGLLSDEELRQRVYSGRNVVVVPSRTDSFNYVSVEALLSGCPLLLSRHTGSAGFLTEEHADIAPPVIDPFDTDACAVELQALLENYDDRARTLRETLRRTPFQRPSTEFMQPVFDGSGTPPWLAFHGTVRPPVSLRGPAAARWRPTRSRSGSEGELSVIVTVRDAPDRLAATLASLERQTAPGFGLVIVDDGSRDPAAVRDVVKGISPHATLVRLGRQGLHRAAGRGRDATDAPCVAFFCAGEIAHPEWHARTRPALEQGAAVVIPAAHVLTVSGVRHSHDPGARDRSMPGLGITIRREGEGASREAVADLAALCRSAPDDSGTLLLDSGTILVWRPLTVPLQEPEPVPGSGGRAETRGAPARV